MDSGSGTNAVVDHKSNASRSNGLVGSPGQICVAIVSKPREYAKASRSWFLSCGTSRWLTRARRTSDWAMRSRSVGVSVPLVSRKPLKCSTTKTFCCRGIPATTVLKSFLASSGRKTPPSRTTSAGGGTDGPPDPARFLPRDAIGSPGCCLGGPSIGGFPGCVPVSETQEKRSHWAEWVPAVAATAVANLPSIATRPRFPGRSRRALPVRYQRTLGGRRVGPPRRPCRLLTVSRLKLYRRTEWLRSVRRATTARLLLVGACRLTRVGTAEHVRDRRHRRYLRPHTT